MITKITLAGQPLDGAIRQEYEIQLKASFENEQIAANISAQGLTFGRRGYALIKQHIADGRIFEPMEFLIEAKDRNGAVNVFEGELLLAKEAVLNDTLMQVDANFEKKDGLNSFSENLAAIDWDFLREKGAITDADYKAVEFQVVAKNQILEAIVLRVTLFTMVQVFLDNIYKINTAISTFVGILSGSLTGSIGAAIFAGIQAVVLLAYQILIAIEIAKIASVIVQQFAPLTRTGKGMAFGKLLEKACTFLGYEFQTSIPELDTYIYFPTVLQGERYSSLDAFLSLPAVQKFGTPTIRDPGYNCADFFTICRNMFNARFAVIGGVVQFHSLASNYWRSTATWIMPDVLEGNYSYNTGDAVAGYTLSFTTDFTDEYTIDEFKGTSYVAYLQSEVGTITGSNTVSIPLALGSRKSRFSGLERILQIFVNGVGGVLKALGNNQNLDRFLTSKIGLLRIGAGELAVAKVVYMQNGRIPDNHKEFLSAKALYNKYHASRSFVANPQVSQHKNFSQVVIPFGLSSFNALVNNSYFTTFNGKLAKALEIDWNVNLDTAIISYYIEEQYTDKLTETFYEPD